MNFKSVKATLRRFALRARDYDYFSHSQDVWIFLVLPFAIFMALVLGVGPELQYYVFSYLHKDAASLYDSAYPEGLADFPPPSEWLIKSTMSWMAVQALLITLLSFKTLKFREVVTRVLVFSFLVLSASDGVNGIVSGAFSIDSMLVNLTANFVGAFLIAALSACALWSYESLALGVGPVRGVIASPVALLVWGLFISLFAYTGFFILYQPTPVHLELTATAPVSGWLSGKGDKSGKATTFQLLPSVSSLGLTKVTNVEGKADFRWRRAVASQRYDLELSLAGDCVGLESLDKLRAKTIAKIDDVAFVDASFDAGYSEIYVGSNSRNKLTLKAATLNSFWVTPQDTQKTDISYMVSKDDVLTIDSSGNNRAFLSTMMIRRAGKKRSLAPRTVLIKTNHGSRAITFPAPKALDNRRMNCGPLEVSRAGNLEIARVPFLTAGILMSINEVATPTAELISKDPQEIKITGMRGWVEANGIKSDELKYKDLGTTNFAAIYGKGLRLSIDGKSIPTNAHDPLSAIGTINGQYEDGTVILSGKSKATWYGERRLNPTKWERLPDEWQRWLLAGLGGLLFGLWKPGRAVISRMKEIERIRVPSRD